MRELQCPSCGAHHGLVNPGIQMVVCDHCRATVYWGEDEALKLGRESVLPPSDARLYMHATGALDGREFQVVGHLRYDYDGGEGSWDEWYLQMADGGVAWLSEDERELSFERPATANVALPPASELSLGLAVAVDGAAYTVREVRTAHCVGGQGQLPFAILPGERYPFADVVSADGRGFATLEYDGDGGEASVFVGEVLGHDRLRIDDERAPSTAGAAQGKAISCANCKADIEIPADRDVKTKVCEYCGAQIELSAGQQKLLGINEASRAKLLNFAIGRAAQLDGARYEICGRMVYRDDWGCISKEYLLFNPDRGYLWLAEENDHFVLNQPTQVAPATDPTGRPPKTPVTIAGEQFQVYEHGRQKLFYVDGALPWVARTGDEVEYVDLIAPPKMFGVEIDGPELEYFIGTYMTPEEVYAAFEQPDPPRASGVHAAQPYLRSLAMRVLMPLGLVLALLNGGLLTWSCGADGREVFNQTFPPEEFQAETTSPPFELPNADILRIETRAGVDNGWVALSMAFLDELEQVVSELDSEVAYYHGVEGGESWSEGGTTATRYVKAPPPGTYRLLVAGSYGNRGGARPATISIRAGAVLSRFFAFAFAVALAFPVFGWLSRHRFETRRWADVLDDDDDDD